MRYSNSVHSVRRAKRSGLTLVEAVLGMFLLGTLLVAMIHSFGQQRAQIQHASTRIDAADAADELLSEWMSGAGTVPLNQSGTWDQRWSWQTSLVRRINVLSVPMNIIALEIREAGRQTARPLVTVEFADHGELRP